MLDAQETTALNAINLILDLEEAALISPSPLWRTARLIKTVILAKLALSDSESI